jgi:Na+-transporting NADH:ubiquinone oxidoreductase subunit C
MATNKRHKSYPYAIGFMIAITVIMIGALAVVNQATEARIQDNLNQRNQVKILEAAGLLPEAYSPQEVTNIFQASFETVSVDGRDLYRLSPSLWVVPVSGNGLWGGIQTYAGIDFSSRTLLGLSIVSHSETPGLGGRIEEADYLDQFTNLSLPDQADFLVYRPREGGNLDAISGATGTSKAVLDFVNAELVRYFDAYERGDLK